MKNISRLHYITQDIPEFSHSELAEFACKGGADWVQLRVKNIPSTRDNEWINIAKEVQQVCKKYRAKLIINDNIFIAKKISADGVHLGKEDVNPKEARKILGKKIVIGGSANSMEDVRRMINYGADYIGIGPFRFTNTKEKLNPVLGSEGIKKIAEQCGKEKINISLIAVGGIKNSDVKPILAAGIYGVAVASAINMEKDKTGATKKFLYELHKSMKQLCSHKMF